MLQGDAEFKKVHNIVECSEYNNTVKAGGNTVYACKKMKLFFFEGQALRNL